MQTSESHSSQFSSPSNLTRFNSNDKRNQNLILLQTANKEQDPKAKKNELILKQGVSRNKASLIYATAINPAKSSEKSSDSQLIKLSGKKKNNVAFISSTTIAKETAYGTQTRDKTDLKLRMKKEVSDTFSSQSGGHLLTH